MKAVVWALAVRATDPFGPSTVDPDAVRDTACDATSPGTVCNPPAPRPIDPPNVGAPPWIGFIGQLFMLLVVAVLVAGIVWLVVRWFRDRPPTESEESDDDDLDEALDEAVERRVIDHETPPDRWRRRAQEHRDRAEYRESIRCQYRALVGDLARAGFVDEIPGRTSGEERTQVAELAPRRNVAERGVVEAFSIAADTFDTAWFDDGVVVAADDERFLAAERTVLDAVLAPSSGRLGRRR